MIRLKLIYTIILILSPTLVFGQTVRSHNAMPEFPGGQQALAKFIYTNMHYPDKAQMLGITGLVKVKFTVLPTGKIINAHIVQDIGGGCGTEALRLVSFMPPWIPGQMNGEPASISVTIPIVFDMREHKIKRKKRNRRAERKLRIAKRKGTSSQ